MVCTMECVDVDQSLQVHDHSLTAMGCSDVQNTFKISEMCFYSHGPTK